MIDEIEKFIKYLKRTKKPYSEHTLWCYRSDIYHFMDFMAIPFSAITFSNDNIQRYIKHLHKTGKADSTIRRRLSSLSKFCCFLVIKRILISDPTIGVKRPKVEKKKSCSISQEQFGQLINKMPLKTTSDFRDRAMFGLLYYTGIRVSELVGLNEGDLTVTLTTNIINVRKNGEPTRCLPINKAAYTPLLDYMLLRNGHAKALFLNKFGKRISQRSVRRRLDRYLKGAGMNSTISPRAFRNSFKDRVTVEHEDKAVVKHLMGYV